VLALGTTVVLLVVPTYTGVRASAVAVGVSDMGGALRDRWRAEERWSLRFTRSADPLTRREQ
jgi:hypothetical protein